MYMFERSAFAGACVSYPHIDLLCMFGFVFILFGNAIRGNASEMRVYDLKRKLLG